MPAEFFYLADVPALSGLGSSRFLRSGNNKSYFKYSKKKSYQNLEIAEISYEIEKQRLNENTGIQDAIAASRNWTKFC